MSLPEFFQATVNSLSNIYIQKYGDNSHNNDDFKIFKNFIESNYKLANENHVEYINYLKNNIYEPYKDEFMSMNKYSIPSNILPPNKVGFICDINVIISNKFKKRYNHFTDDYVYYNNLNVQKHIPRGLTICQIMSKDKEEKEREEFHEICIYSNRKFAGVTDEDDDDKSHQEQDGRKYFLQGIEKEKGGGKIVAMEKINGEALHFSGRYLLDKFYYFVGSKRNHIMISDKDDIEFYTNERHEHAKKFAQSLMKKLQQLPVIKLKILQELLHYTKVTVTCEILQPSYQHVVQILGEEDKIVFLNFSALPHDAESLTAFPPHIACKVMDALNFTSANCEMVDTVEERSIIEKVRSKENSEGSVLYYLNENYQTIGFLKLKTEWYICLRALREKLSRHVGDVNKNRIIRTPVEERINKRYDEIQQWLTLTDHQTNEWKRIAKQFTDWLLALGRDVVSAESVKSQFPIFWNEFLETRKDNVI